MKKPECKCFESGDLVAKVIALETEAVFSSMMADSHVCREAQKYVLITVMCLLMKTVAAQEADGDHEKENAGFQRLCDGLGGVVRTRGNEMRKEALDHLRKGLH